MKAFDFFQCRGRTENTASTDLSFSNVFCLGMLPFKSLLPDPPGISLSCHPFSEKKKKKPTHALQSVMALYISHQRAGEKNENFGLEWQMRVTDSEQSEEGILKPDGGDLAVLDGATVQKSVFGSLVLSESSVPSVSI